MRSKVNNTYKYIKLMNKNSQKVYQLKMTTSVSVFKYEWQTYFTDKFNFISNFNLQTAKFFIFDYFSLGKMHQNLNIFYICVRRKYAHSSTP